MMQVEVVMGTDLCGGRGIRSCISTSSGQSLTRGEGGQSANCVLAISDVIVPVIGIVTVTVRVIFTSDMDDELLVNHTRVTLGDAVWSLGDARVSSGWHGGGGGGGDVRGGNSSTMPMPMSGEEDNVTATMVNDVTIAAATGGCGDWEPAQHNLFQFSNICFAAAFCMPRSFKPSVLFFRTLLCCGFLVSAIWAGVHICSPDIFAWNMILSLTNLVHSIILTCRFLPPPLSVELADLYDRLFKPLRVSKKHFKELTKEANMCHLTRGECYAIQESTPSDERLSILLKGKLRVTCDNMHLHYINSHQFIDSPEWEASHETSDELFQVTITAEEDCLYLCWPKLRLDRVLRHRPMLQTILSNLIGKDITQKLYSLNEQLGNSINTLELAKASSDHWRHVMSRSLSVDAVNTGTRGNVRSVSWKTAHDTDRRNSETEPSLYGHQCWIPVVANHFPATSPFSRDGNEQQPSSQTHTWRPPPPPPCLPSAAASAAMTATSQQPPVALIPVIVPMMAPSSSSVPANLPLTPRTRVGRVVREVTFDDSNV